jgi:hypothetical protein
MQDNPLRYFKYRRQGYFYDRCSIRWIGLIRSASTSAVTKAITVTIVKSLGSGIVS